MGFWCICIPTEEVLWKLRFISFSRATGHRRGGETCCDFAPDVIFHHHQSWHFGNVPSEITCSIRPTVLVRCIACWGPPDRMHYKPYGWCLEMLPQQLISYPVCRIATTLSCQVYRIPQQDRSRGNQHFWEPTKVHVLNMIVLFDYGKQLQLTHPIYWSIVPSIVLCPTGLMGCLILSYSEIVTFEIMLNFFPASTRFVSHVSYVGLLKLTPICRSPLFAHQENQTI